MPFRRPPRRRPAAAFTLVELLIVIGIIGMLAALLMPAMSKARRDAQKIVCMSNQRDVGIHLQMYSNNSKGWMFPPLRGANRPREERWTVFVFEGGAWNPKVMLCPSDLEPVNEHSFLLNDNLTLQAIKNHTTHIGTGATASDIIVMGEKCSSEPDYYMNPGSADYIGVVEYYRHGVNYGSNYLYLDGHVETTTPLIANQGIDPWNPAKPIPPPPPGGA